MGLPPLVHAQMGVAVAHPLDCPTAVPLDAAFCCHQMVTQHSFSNWQRKHIALLKHYCAKLAPLAAVFAAVQDPDDSVVCSRVSPTVLDGITKSVVWTDVGHSWIPVVGVNVAGDMPVCGIYQHENKQPEMSIDLGTLMNHPSTHESISHGVKQKLATLAEALSARH